MKLKNKIILITGATSGIGLELLKSLYPDNQIIALGRNQNKLKNLINKYPRLNTYKVDLAKLEEVELFVQKLKNKIKNINLLINNAAIQNTALITSDGYNIDVIRKEVTINFTSICCLIYLLIPLLDKSKDAAIVNINSGLAIVPKTSSAIYCGTKGGLNIFTQSLKYQLENTSIKVLQAFLPLVDTSMTAGRGSKKIDASFASEKIIHGIKNNIANNYIGKVKLLVLINRFIPMLAKKIMKNA